MKRIILLIVTTLFAVACSANPANPNMNTNGPDKITCPEGFGSDCTVTIGHFEVTDNCEYQTDTPYPEKITYWSIVDGISINGMVLVVDQKYTLDYPPGGSADSFVCVLDFTSENEYPRVNFEIIRQNN